MGVAALRLVRQRHRRAVRRDAPLGIGAGRRGHRVRRIPGSRPPRRSPRLAPSRFSCDTDADNLHHRPGEQIEAKITPARSASFRSISTASRPTWTPIMAIARETRLWVIEDCAQAHLAKFQRAQGSALSAPPRRSPSIPARTSARWAMPGRWSPNDAELARAGRCRAARRLTKGDHEIEGINSRLDGLQAALLSA